MRTSVHTLADIPRLHARERPDALAMSFQGRETTFAEWDRNASKIAAGLLELGLPRGARAAYLGKNSDRFYDLLAGVAKSGMVLVPLNWRYAMRELVEVVEDAEASVLFFGADYREEAAELARRVPSLRVIVSVEDEPGAAPCLSRWYARPEPADPIVVESAEDVVLQLYTSGTTGTPKGVELTNANMVALCRARIDSGDIGNWSAQDMYLQCLPVFHAGGACVGLYALYAGVSLFVLEEVHVPRMIEAFKSHPITKLGVVPAVLAMLLDHPGCAPEDFAHLDLVLYGGSPISPELLRRAIGVMGCEFVQVYGMTETSTLGTVLSSCDHDLQRPELLLSCGKAGTGVDVRIVDREGRDLPVGESGEIVLRTAGIMKGYWRRQAETAAVCRDGWYYTGDGGCVDAAGYLYLRDRIKDMIVSGGENVYPAEVEKVLAEHAAVAEVAVFGVPDVRWGEAVKAAVVPRAGATVTQDELIEFARERIARFKCPRTVDIVESLPRNASGKVLKRLLRDPYWQGIERQIN